MSKKSDSVFVEGSPVVKTESPYSKFHNEDMEKEFIRPVVNNKMGKNNLRLQCIKLAIDAGAKDPDRIMLLAKRFWHFARTGD